VTIEVGSIHKKQLHTSVEDGSHKVTMVCGHNMV